MLFSLFFDRVYDFLHDVMDAQPDMEMFSIGLIQFCILLFADDAVLVATDVEQL